MTLVLDRPGPGARVHVLAIGVGGYRHLKGGTAPVNHPTLKLGQLSGPSHSTHAFVDWVVNRMHHPTIEVATVELLASVAVGEDSPSDMPPVELPTRSNVEAAFLRWFDRCDTDAANVALFYFCGHGVQKGPNYLLLEDFGASRLDLLQNSVDITATYQGMARCRANSQYFFVDACREVPVELLQMLQGSPAVLVAPEAVGDDRESALLMATSGGHRAYGKARQATQFTEALIRALDGLGARFDGGRWVIDYLGLQRATTTLLRGDGMSPRSQRPQSYGAAGDEILHVCDGPPVVPVSVRCDPVEALAEPAATAALRNSAGGSDHSLRANAKGWSGEVAAGSYDLCIDFPAGRYVSYRSSVLALPPGLEWPPGTGPAMSSSLRITFEPGEDEGPSPAPPIAAEVVGPDFTRHTMPMRAGETSTLELPRGTYSVSALTPDGEVLSATVHLDSSRPADVTLRPAKRSAEFEIGPSHERPRMSYIDEFSVADVREVWRLEGGRPSRHPTAFAWATVWQQAGQQAFWSVSQMSKRVDGIDFVLLHERRTLVHLGGPESAWRTIALPPARETRLTVTQVDKVGDFDDGLQVDIRSMNPQAGAMMDYLAAGHIEQARVVAGDLEQLAIRLFREKMKSAEGAAAAGYVLLRMHRTDRWRDWSRNFANLCGWLPDALVIRASVLLRDGKAEDLPEARERLLRATSLGVPLYTEGLRLLFDGLRLLAGSAPSDGAVKEALGRVRAFADACDWSATMTTFWSPSVERPSLRRRTGWFAGHDVLTLEAL